MRQGTVDDTLGLARSAPGGGAIAGTRVHAGDDLRVRCDDVVSGVLDRWALGSVAGATVDVVHAAVRQALAVDDHADIRLRRLPERLEIDIRPCGCEPLVPGDADVQVHVDGDTTVVRLPLAC